MSKNGKDLKDFIIKTIEQKGFTLENYVTNLLSKKDWLVFPSSHYHDKDLDKDREIDIVAEKTILSHDKTISFEFILVIECKKVPGNGWVFFPNPKQKNVRILHVPHFFTLLDAFNVDEKVLPKPLINLDKRGFYSHSYTEIIIDQNCSNRREDNLFDAIMSVTKAASAQKDIFLKNDDVAEISDMFKKRKLARWLKDGCPMSICFVFPIVIFEGNMYSTIFPLNKENLKESNLIHLFGEYRSGHYQETICIDIVSKDETKAYFDLLDGEIRKIAFKTTTDRQLKEHIINKIKNLYDENSAHLIF